MRQRHAITLLLWISALHSPSAPADEPRLLLAFSSYRERPQHPQIYFYEHDGVAMGKMVEGLPTLPKRSDHRPSLSADGRWCAFSSEVENDPSRILLFDRQEKKLVDLPTINESPHAQLWPSLSGDGRLIAFAAWNRPNSSQRWDLFLYDVPGQRLAPLGEVNTLPHDERMPALNGTGDLVAYVVNHKETVGGTDIALCDLKTGQQIALPGLNSEGREMEPSLSSDGRYVVFASDRPGGKGFKDIYLYDREIARLVDLPGLNSVAQEQTPAISQDGRYIVFVSERTAGEGERDIFLYDVRQQKLLPTPGLNARQEDFDPCVIVLPTK